MRSTPHFSWLHLLAVRGIANKIGSPMAKPESIRAVCKSPTCWCGLERQSHCFARGKTNMGQGPFPGGRQNRFELPPVITR